MDKKTLDSRLEYEPLTGLFRNRICRGTKARAGDVAGTKTEQGYIRINVDGKLYYAQRLAILTTTGSMPVGVVDHINGNRSDNRIENLRVVSHAENMQNRFTPSGENPYVGVSLVRGKWQASVTRFGMSVHLGMFESPEAARDAYQASRSMTHADFAKLARSCRRKNRLATELSSILEDFPGFESSAQQQSEWLSRRLEALS